MTDEVPGLARYIDAVSAPVELGEVTGRRRGRGSPRRRVLAVAVAVVVVSVGVAFVAHQASGPTRKSTTGSASTSASDGSFRNAVPVGQAGIIGPDSGWAMNGIGLYRTDDNGSRWLNITPPHSSADPLGNVTAVSFLGTDDAWAAVATNHFGAIYRSTDGGRSWTTTAPLTGCPIVNNTSNCGAVTTIRFTDALHGWLFGETGFTTGNVFGTVNGGRTWQFLSEAPFDGPIVFADSQHGWGISDPSAYNTQSGQPTKAGGALYGTTNGGRSWQRVTLPAIPGLGSGSATYGLPSFFGRVGVVAAWLRTRATAAPTVVIYTTNDAGQSWTGRSAPSNPAAARYGLATSPPLPFSAADRSTWVLYLGTDLFETVDAGRHWTTVTAAPPIRSFRSVMFTSASNGWALVDPNAALVRTSDGGKSWQLLAPADSAATPSTPVAASVSATEGQPAFLSTTEGWICATPLRYSTNGGVTWQSINVGTNNISFGIACAFAPGGHAWIATYGPHNTTPRIVRVIAGPHPVVTASPLPSAAPNDWVQSLAFADPLHGWAVATRSNATPNPPSTVYRTVDGGVHWQPIVSNAPVSSALRFTSPTTGWGIGGAFNRQLERTDDGGRTWHNLPIVPTPVLDTNLIGGLVSVFPFGQRIVVDGFLPTGNFGKLFIEVSNDDGAHWSLQTVSTDIVQPPGTAFWQFVAVDATHWRVGDFGLLLGTDDAGTSWPVRSTRLPPNATGITFVTPNNGWAAECSGSTCHAAVTADAGRSWRMLTQP